MARNPAWQRVEALLSLNDPCAQERFNEAAAYVDYQDAETFWIEMDAELVECEATNLP